MNTLTKVLSAATLLILSLNAGVSNAAEGKDPTPTAAQYREEAATLSQKAATHHKMGVQYRNRGPGQDGYDMARHCESLADSYEKASKDARTIAELLEKRDAAPGR